MPLSIVVVGAGLGGLATAITCRLAGHDVTVLEQAPALSEVGAGIQLMPNITRLLIRWGMGDSLKRLAVFPRKIDFRRWQDGQVIGRTALAPELERDYGAPYMVCHRAHLLEVLKDRAEELGAQIHLGQTVTSLEVAPLRITTASGRIDTPDLGIGADGIKSATKKLLYGEKDVGPKQTRFCAYRATVPAEAMMTDPDLAKIINDPVINLWVGEDRHVMSYPISGGKTFNMVLSHPAPKEKVWATDAATVLQEMQDNYQGWDPVLVKVIKLVKSTMRWPLMTSEKLDTWINQERNFALLGDSCHAMLPYMSSGAGMAIEDAAALGVVLEPLAKSSSTKYNLASALELYEKARKERAYAVAYRSELNGRIWHYPDGEAQQARDEGMRASTTGEHYLRSTNQWSDPATQLWLFGHDAESAARKLLPTAQVNGMQNGYHDDASDIEEMKQAGLL